MKLSHLENNTILTSSTTAQSLLFKRKSKKYNQTVINNVFHFFKRTPITLQKYNTTKRKILTYRYVFFLLSALFLCLTFVTFQTKMYIHLPWFPISVLSIKAVIIAICLGMAIPAFLIGLNMHPIKEIVRVHFNRSQNRLREYWNTYVDISQPMTDCDRMKHLLRAHAHQETQDNIQKLLIELRKECERIQHSPLTSKERDAKLALALDKLESDIEALLLHFKKHIAALAFTHCSDTGYLSRQ